MFTVLGLVQLHFNSSFINQHQAICKWNSFQGTHSQGVCLIHVVNMYVCLYECVNIGYDVPVIQNLIAGRGGGADR